MLNAHKYTKLKSSSHLRADLICDDIHKLVVTFFSVVRTMEDVNKTLNQYTVLSTRFHSLV